MMRDANRKKETKQVSYEWCSPTDLASDPQLRDMAHNFVNNIIIQAKEEACDQIRHNNIILKKELQESLAKNTELETQVKKIEQTARELAAQVMQLSRNLEVEQVLRRKTQEQFHALQAQQRSEHDTKESLRYQMKNLETELGNFVDINGNLQLRVKELQDENIRMQAKELPSVIRAAIELGVDGSGQDADSKLQTGKFKMVGKYSIEEIEVSDFFPNACDDLSVISWENAVNSKRLLEKSINNDGIMMLVADVMSGHLEGESKADLLCAIMAHPPATSSNISLKGWIRRVIDANQNGKKKGAKFDFKDEDILEASLEILKSRINEIKFPLWIHADILKGRHDSSTKAINADKFLKLCSKYLPKATLSVGWTTANIDVSDEFAVYTKEMVEEMKEVLERNNIVQPVNFPVRAAFLGASLENLEWLVENVPDSSITVWSRSDDTVDITTLVTLRKKIGIDAVLVDLSSEHQKEFEVTKSAEASAAAPTYALFPSDTSFYATAAVGVVLWLLILYYYG